MHLGNTAPIVEAFDGLPTGEVLSRITSARVARGRAELEELVGIVAWADHNTLDTPAGAATLRDGFLDTGIPIAGPGTPLVSEFGLMELIATLERSPDSGRHYVGKVIEAAWRLPVIWQTVLDGRCPAWKALQVADLTRPLTAAAAGHVDQHLGHAITTCTGRADSAGG
jgi:hypothetical protein